MEGALIYDVPDIEYQIARNLSYSDLKEFLRNSHSFKREVDSKEIGKLKRLLQQKYNDIVHQVENDIFDKFMTLLQYLNTEVQMYVITSIYDQDYQALADNIRQSKINEIVIFHSPGMSEHSMEDTHGIYHKIVRVNTIKSIILNAIQNRTLIGFWHADVLHRNDEMFAEFRNISIDNQEAVNLFRYFKDLPGSISIEDTPFIKTYLDTKTTVAYYVAKTIRDKTM